MPRPESSMKGQEVNPHPKMTALIAAIAVTAAGLALAPAAATADTGPTLARPGAPGQPKLVKVRSSDRKVTVSDTRFRPGVTEFRVTKTAHRGSSLLIVETKDLDRAFKLLGKAFSGEPGSADAMKMFDRLVTIYGGGPEGARWQVKLPQGSYYMLDGKTNKLTTFKVKGERRGAKMQRANSTVTTTRDNQFKTSGPLAGKWVGFANHSREIHFMEANKVARDVTAKDVRDSLKSDQKPDWFRRGGFFLEVQSPGIETVHFQDVALGRYLLMCWMPSEEQDGVPHAMMGMWHLVNAV